MSGVQQQQQQGWFAWGVGLAKNAVSGVWWLASSTAGLLFGTSEPQTPLAEAQRFVARFAATYGGDSEGRQQLPPFFEGGFADAVAAARGAGKLLLVYLHAELHADTGAFCRGTLCAPAVAAFLAERFVVWGGDVRAAEAYAVSNAIGASRFPFVAVVDAFPAPPQPLAQIAGLRDPGEFVAALAAVAEGPGAAALARTARAEEGRALRAEQLTAFEQSLAADRAKEAARAREAAARADAERRRREAQSAREMAVRRRAALLGDDEPRGPGVATVAVRLPDGRRVSRRFRVDDSLAVVFAFVDRHLFSVGQQQQQEAATDDDEQQKLADYALCTNFPRMEYTWERADDVRVETLGDQALMYVRVLDDDDEDGGCGEGNDGDTEESAAPHP